MYYALKECERQAQFLFRNVVQRLESAQRQIMDRRQECGASLGLTDACDRNKRLQSLGLKRRSGKMGQGDIHASLKRWNEMRW